MARIACFAATFLLILQASAAKSATIVVESTSKDNVGQSIVYNLKEKINRSSIYKLVYTENDAGFIIRLTTLEQNDGRSSVYAAVLLLPPIDKNGFNYYVTSQVGFCGSDVTEKCAAQILAGFDEDISSVMSAFAEISKKSK